MACEDVTPVLVILTHAPDSDEKSLAHVSLFAGAGLLIMGFAHLGAWEPEPLAPKPPDHSRYINVSN